VRLRGSAVRRRGVPCVAGNGVATKMMEAAAAPVCCVCGGISINSDIFHALKSRGQVNVLGQRLPSMSVPSKLACALSGIALVCSPPLPLYPAGDRMPSTMRRAFSESRDPNSTRWPAAAQVAAVWVPRRPVPRIPIVKLDIGLLGIAQDFLDSDPSASCAGSFSGVSDASAASDEQNTSKNEYKAKCDQKHERILGVVTL
jgi:hypothetical protein